MDEYSNKSSTGRLFVNRNGTRIGTRDASNSKGQSNQFCNRIGCSGRLNTARGIQNGCSETPKIIRPAHKCSTSGKEVVGSPSHSFHAVTSTRRPLNEARKKLTLQLETNSSESSCKSGSIVDDPEAVELGSPSGNIQRRIEGHDNDGDDYTSIAVVSPITASSSSQKSFIRRPGMAKKEIQPNTSTSRDVSRGVRQNTHTNRYGLRSLRCNSTADVIPSGFSSTESSMTNKKEMLKRRNSDGETSVSSKGKKASPLENGQKSRPGIGIVDTRQTRSSQLNRDNVLASVRTRRPISSSQTRIRLPNQENRNSSSLGESHLLVSRRNQPEVPITRRVSSSPSENNVNQRTTYSRPGTGESSRRRVSAASPESGVSHSLTNREGLLHYNIDGIAEMLLALERIEQESELTYEQLLNLETNLFLHGLSFNDQHRDMRMDIDNMSYEELLALEERMGSVSTALTEEALEKCLNISFHKPRNPEDGTMEFDEEEDEVKCSICQEDYVIGDEVGRLPCEHGYHVVCIQQWLRQKNWCPICKASAEDKSSYPS